MHARTGHACMHVEDFRLFFSLILVALFSLSHQWINKRKITHAAFAWFLVMGGRTATTDRRQQKAWSLYVDRGKEAKG